MWPVWLGIGIALFLVFFGAFGAGSETAERECGRRLAEALAEVDRRQLPHAGLLPLPRPPIEDNGWHRAPPTMPEITFSELAAWPDVIDREIDSWDWEEKS